MSEEENNNIQEDELYEHHRIVVDPGQEPLRIDRFLVNRLPKISRNRIQVAAKAGSILVDEKPVKSNFKVKPGHTVSIVLHKPPQEHSLLPEDIPLDIIYEDDTVLVLNKAAGMVVHPGHGNWSGTLVNALIHHYRKDLPDNSENNDRPGLVHRLDKGTTGLMVIAKTDTAMTHMAKQFFDRTVKRTYQAIVWGEPSEEEGRIEGNIGRHPRFRKKMTVFPDGEEGKFAATNYTVLERIGYVSMVECRLETGRTHQIRVHMKHLGHPLFNDDTYEGDRIVKGTVYSKYKTFVHHTFELIPRPALHAKTLGFIHPETGEEMFFDSELPSEMVQVADRWRKYMTFNS
ncbi:RluA family pseudouridine synthase [Chitinophagales bacterium]|nr:RluA family pseudouridine synthase [Chitinophagales bacterium]